MSLPFSDIEGLSPTVEPDVEDFARAATDAFERADDALALEQVAAALSFAPLRPDLLHLLERLLARHRSPRKAFEEHLRRRPFFGFHAAEAWADARAGKLGPALEKLVQVACYRPGPPYLLWAERWVAGPSGTRGVSIADLLPHLSRLVVVTGRHRMEDVRDTVEAATRLVHRLRTDRPQAAPSLALLESAWLRQMGFPGHAVSVVEPYESKASFELFVELGCAHRASGNWDRVVICCERALALTKDRLPVLVDLADARLEIGDISGALHAYEEALALSGSASEDELTLHAAASLAYARVIGHQDVEAREQLEGLAKRSSLAAKLLTDLDAYRTWLPPLRDPLADAIRHFIARARTDGAKSARFRLTADTHSNPLARWAVETAGRALGSVFTFVEVDRDPARPSDPSTVDTFVVSPLDVLGPSAAIFDIDAWIASRPRIRGDELRNMLEHGVPADSDDPLHDLFVSRLALLAAAAHRAADDADAWVILESEVSSLDPWRSAAAVVVLGAVARAGGARAAEAARLVQASAETSTHPAISIALGLPGGSLRQRGELLRRKKEIERDASASWSR